MRNAMGEPIVKVGVRCPLCGWRLVDKLTPSRGKIQIKCPKCRKEVILNLAFRRQRNSY